MSDQAIAAQCDPKARYLRGVLLDDKNNVTGIEFTVETTPWAQDDSREEAALLRMEAQMGKDKEMIDQKRKLTEKQTEYWEAKRKAAEKMLELKKTRTTNGRHPSLFYNPTIAVEPNGDHPRSQ